MSSIYVKVNTDVMKTQSNQVRDDVNKIDRSWKSIGKLISGSKGYWEGEASDAHIKAYKEIEADVEMVIKRLADNVVKLQQDAGVYEEAVNRIDGEISPLQTDIF